MINMLTNKEFLMDMFKKEVTDKASLIIFHNTVAESLGNEKDDISNDDECNYDE